MSESGGYETPDWFWEAIDCKPESHTVEVDDADINCLTWSEPGNPGLLFVHGHNAHAHWWDFIAPSFRDEYQTAAIDLSGMGDSDHRDEYSSDTYAREIVAVADYLQMPQNTIVVAHSFGGLMSLRCFALHPGRFAGLILVDSGVRHPDDIKEREAQIPRLGRAKTYPNREVAISRFRLQPPQQCANQYIVDHIARNSVEYDDMEEGWLWKFDEELNSRMVPRGDSESDLAAVTDKMALIYGAESESYSQKSAEYMASLKPGMSVIRMEDAQHHLFLDQPLDFIAQLKGLLNGWR
ncbi:MAG: alpha/beta hydrolase [Pseudomonadales bacterium]|nr:alpha/beta hydrolase [Pseudomonadales bacterium]